MKKLLNDTDAEAQTLYSKMDLYRRIVQAKLYIDKHYSEKIDLSNIAEEAFFSKYHFLRVFRDIYGLTPHHYLIQTRINHARELLEKQFRIGETSMAVGFESATSFTAVFRKLTGQTPSAFRASAKLKQSMIRQNPLQAVPNCFAETHGWVKNSNF